MTAEPQATETLSVAEQEALAILRDRFQQDRDLFSPRELAQLRFLRWLVQTGRMEP